MMWKRMRPLLVLLSVTLNVAFVAVWGEHALSARLHGSPGPAASGDEGVTCPLHRQLGMTGMQWRRDIEPRLVKFQESARAICGEVSQSRVELIDLIAAPEPDLEVIAAKQEEILAGQRRMQKLVIDHLFSEKSVLTQDQQRKLFDMLRQRTGCAGHGPMMGSVGMGKLRPDQCR